MRLEPDPERARLNLARGQPFSSREAGPERHGQSVPWHRWGPYLADRHWATVREDYSALGDAWEFFPHDHARSRAYRWGEDGLLGICDDQMRLCFAVALWNGADPILKERLFGLVGAEGNHGEDVKEYYYFLDGTPTHSYMRALYKYPQRAFPYAELVAENRRRSRFEPEYELIDTGVFADDRYFDVEVEYAKADPADIVIRLSITNRGPSHASLDVLPTVWFRNTWSWDNSVARPSLRHAGAGLIEATHPGLGRYWLAGAGRPELLFTDNDTNTFRLWGVPNVGRYVKDGINDALVHGLTSAVNPDLVGTKAAMRYQLALAPGQSQAILLRLANHPLDASPSVSRQSLSATDAAPGVSRHSLIGFDTRQGAQRSADDSSMGSPTGVDTRQGAQPSAPDSAMGSPTGVDIRQGPPRSAPDSAISSPTGVDTPEGPRRLAPESAVDSPAGVDTRQGAQRLAYESNVSDWFDDVADILALRRSEADLFYATGFGAEYLTKDERLVQRQACAGLLWSKQVYIWDIECWLAGDPAGPPPPEERKRGRNSGWWHFNTQHVLSVPDTWEYPWFAAWDLAFHCVPLAQLDVEFAKDQLEIMLREWYMHPNGQLPAYEWAFDAVNPPVHAWATWRVYDTERRLTGVGDRAFLEGVFHKLLLNFTWWVNRKDPEGLNVFQGGFLGLDNIGVIDRGAELPGGGRLEQSDGTAWMGMYTLNMLQIALELARANPVYEDVANKFFQHFLYVASAMNNVGGKGFSLWDETDEFFYDILHAPDADPTSGGSAAANFWPDRAGFESRESVLRVRSLVGLIPLLAVETIEPDLLERLPRFRARLEWFLENRPALASLVSRWQEPGLGERRLLALVRGHRMKRLLKRMLDPEEFLSDFGVRSVSKHHAEHPFVLDLAGQRHEVGYEPGDSTTSILGGNSNWRGPIWMPINFLLIEALRKFHHYYGDDFRVECPTGSGTVLTLNEVADELTRRLTNLFRRANSGRRPINGGCDFLESDNVLFHEYFHGDTGQGLGASHQTGWTALIATLLADRHIRS